MCVAGKYFQANSIAIVFTFWLSPPLADAATFSYKTTLGPADHVSSNGSQLTTVADMLRQDRANVHLRGKLDAGDQADGFFANKEARSLFEQARVQIDNELQRRILSGQAVTVEAHCDVDSQNQLQILVSESEAAKHIEQGKSEELRYRTTLGPRDFQNSKGQQLKKWGEVLAQDRANVNSFARADVGDERDGIFVSPERRSSLQQASVQVANEVLAEFQTGAWLSVEVVVWKDNTVQVARAQPSLAAVPKEPDTPQKRSPAMDRKAFDAALAVRDETRLSVLPPAGTAVWRTTPKIVFQAYDSGEESLDCVSDDGTHALSSLGPELHIWNLQSRMIAFSSRLQAYGLKGELSACCLHNSGRYLALQLGDEWQLLDLETETRIQHWTGQPEAVIPVFSPDGCWMAAHDREGVFALPLSQDGRLQRSAPAFGKQPWITAAGSLHAFAPVELPANFADPTTDDNNRVSVTGRFEIHDKALSSKWSIWSAVRGAFDHQLELQSLKWAPDGRLIVRRSSGDVLLDLATLQEGRPAPGHLQEDTPRGSLFSSLELPELPAKEISWLRPDGSLTKLLQLKEGWQANDHRSSPTGDLLWVGLQRFVEQGLEKGREEMWKLLSTNDGTEIMSRRCTSLYNVPSKVETHGMATYATGHLFVGSNSLLVGDVLFDITTRSELRQLPGVILGLSQDRKKIAYLVLEAGRWHAETLDEKGRVVHSAPTTFEANFDGVMVSRVAPDAGSIWFPPKPSLSPGDPMRLVSLRSGRMLHEFPYVPGPFAFFSPDGGHLFALGKEGKTSRIDTATGECTELIPASLYPVHYWFGDHVQDVPDSVLYPRYLSEGAGSEEMLIMSGEGRQISHINKPDFRLNESAFSCSRDGRRLLLENSYGGGHQIRDVKTGRKLCDAFGLQTGDWLLVLPDGTFAASPRATLAVGVRLQGSIHPLDHFDLTLNRPDKVLAALQGEPARISHLERLVQIRLKAAGVNAQALLPAAVHAASTIEIQTQEISSDRQRVRTRCSLRGIKPSDFLSTTHNGVPRHREPLASASPAGTMEVELDFPLATGTNRFGFEIQSTDGNRSARFLTEIEGPETGSTPTLHAVIIGVENYPGEKNKLPGALADAKGLQTALMAANHRGQAVKTTLLLNNDATATNILSLVTKAARATALNDTLLVYLAGHGENDPKLGFRFLDPTYNLDTRMGDSILLSQLVESMNSTQALRRVLLIDACAVGSRVDGDLAPDLEDIFISPTRMAGITILGAARWNQSAGESDKIGHGFFTYALLQAIEGARPETWDIKHLGMTRLTSFLIDEVSRLSGGSQTPAVVANNPDVDVILLRRPEP